MTAPTPASAALRRRLARTNGPVHDADRVEAPLSYIQESIWLLDRFSDGTAPSVVRPCVLTLPTVWTGDEIANALAKVVERHHGLRSVFPLVDGSPCQRLLAPFTPFVREVPAGSRDGWEGAVTALVGQASDRLAPIADQPPLGAGADLVNGPGDRNALVLPFHHVMFDGLSEQLFCAELTAALEASAAGREIDLQPPRLQPADWAVWQRANRGPDALQQSLDWWVDRLDGLRGRTAHRDDDGPVSVTEHAVRLPQNAVDRLVSKGSDNDASLFAVLLHTLSSSVAELTGEDNTAVGVPVSGRTSESLERVIGCFINMLIVRPGPSMTSARDDLLAALDHQDVPYAWIVNQLLPGAGPRQQLVDVSMQLRNFNVERGRASVDAVQPWPKHVGTPSRSVDIIATPNEEGLAIEVRGTGGRFGIEFVGQLAETIEDTAHRLVDRAAPSATSADSESLGWIGASSPHRPPPPPKVHRPLLMQINEQVEADPDAVALRWAGMTIGRGELWARAGQLADLLALAGVGKGDVVAIAGRRCPGIVVGQLAVMRLGAVMVMVDPLFPLSYRDHVVDSASARTIIDVGGEHWDADDGRRLPVDLLGLASASGPGRSHDEGLDVDREDPAYIMFTSGTTGRPKGILGTQRTLGHLAHWAVEQGGLTEDDRVGFVIGVSFDVMFRTTIVPLAAGAEVAISADPLSPGSALQWMADEKVTVLAVTPTMARTWAGEADPDLRVETLRSTWFSGEVLTPDVLSRWESAIGNPGSSLNLYGPTETGSFKVFGPARPGSVGARIAVGKPVAETEVLLVDGDDRPVPQGSHGQVLIRTRGGTAGYLDAEQASGRFVPNPWRDDESDVVYRTGDTGYINPTGALVIVGRVDDQVQVGGFRVELNGTAATIEQLEEVRHCVVEADRSGPDLNLVAYVVPEDGAEIDHRTVVGHAAGHLPRPAVPARVVTLDRLPLTPSGKLDRRGLPQPSGPTTTEPPRLPTEIKLARLWTEVLGVDAIGRNDDFVALGGTSLMALIVVDRVASDFGIELSFNDLVDRRTLAEVAALIDETTPSSEGQQGGPPRSSSTRHPLMPLQAGMWFEQQLRPDSDAYNIPMVHILRGPLDIEALRAAFGAVVAAHEPLRTVITIDDGVPVAEVIDGAEPEIEFTDLGDVDAGRREKMAKAAADEAANRSFDLAGPPLRVALIRLTPEHHILAIVVHHVAFDGGSKAVLVTAMNAAYSAALSGVAVELPPPAVAYRNHPVVADATPTAEAVQRRVAELSPVPPPPAWPVVADPVAGAPTATIDIDIGSALTEGLAAVGRTLRATRASVGLAAHIAFVHAVTGAEAVLVAIPASLRGPRDDDAIGMYVNTLIVRAEPKHDLPFSALVDEVRMQLAASFDARALPFDRLAHDMRLQSRGAGMPVTTTFQLGEPDRSPDLTLEGLTVERHPAQLAAAKFPVAVSLLAKRGEYRLRLAPSVGDEAVAKALAERGSRLLLAALDDPDAVLGELDRTDDGRLCPDSDVRPETSESGDRWLERIAVATADDPQRPSVEWDGGGWSRLELWTAAVAAATELKEAGCRDGSRVALVAKRSPELVATMVGIRMLGAAWIALDPNQPEVRIRSIIDRLAPDAIIAERSDHQHMDVAAPLLQPSIAKPDAQAPEAIDPSALGSPGDTAYLIATSGSTGVPHVVAVPPTALDAFVNAAIERYGLTAEDRVLQFHSTAFDASIEEIGPSLAVGATLVLAPDSPLSSTQRYIRDLDDHGVTAASLPTRFWQQLVEDLAAGRTPRPEHLRLLIIGGEQVQPSTVKAWGDAVGPRITLLNSYGPTESTVVTHVADLTGWAGDEQDAVPIGSPMGSNTERVVGSDGSTVAPGQSGELWLGGPQLARGYLDEPEVTASRFVTEDGVRWFKTGDLVRRLVDGSLSFVSRLDDQVKIRGHRVELAEVAQAIEGHPAVTAAAVLVEDAQGDSRLVAHVEAPTTIDSEDVRSHLRRTVPEYLIPGRIVIEAALPRTPGGKVDRAALRDGGAASTPDGEAATESPIPDELAAIWMDVLEVDSADPADDFFAVGGHSLLAVKLVSQLEEVFGQEIPLVTLVEDPTLGAIAAHLGLSTDAYRPPSPTAPDTRSRDAGPSVTPQREARRPVARQPVVPLADAAQPASPQPEAGPQPEPLQLRTSLRRLHLDRGPLGSAQRRLWFLQQLDRDSTAYHIPVVLELRGPLDVEALAAAVRSTAAAHEALRTRVVVDGGTIIQVVDGEPQVTLDRLSVDPALSVAGVDRLLAANADRPFRLDRDHPFRSALLSAGPDHFVLQLVFHHVAVDGGSVPQILADITTGYRRALEDDEQPIEAPGLQQLDVAIDEHAKLAGGDFEPVEQWWKTQLEDLPGAMQLPESGDGDAPSRVDMWLDGATTEGLVLLADRHQASTTVIVLALTAAALGRLTGRRDVIIGLPATQRESRTEDVVGCFVNTLPIRCRFDDGMTMAQLIGEVRRTVMAAVDHRHLPVDQMVDITGDGSGGRDPGRPDLLQVVCNVGASSTRAPELELPGVLVSRWGRSPGSVAAKFELTVTGGISDGRLRLHIMTDSPRIGRGGTRVIAEAMEALAAAGDDAINAVPIVGEAGRRWLVDDLNPAAGRDPSTARVDELVAEQVAVAPDAIAIVEGSERRTYRRLWADAQEVAQRLELLGVKPGDRVALIADRSIEQVVWSLGILIRQAVYVPIDPGNPKRRITRLVEDADPVAVVRLTGDAATVTGRAEQSLPGCGPDAAYVMYTSGSTGTAKGVVVPHQAIVRLVHQVGYVELGPDSVVAHVSNPAFDAATFEVWGALCSGGRLVVIPRSAGADPARLASTIEEHRISTMFLTTALFNTMAASRPEALGRLDQLLFGGEAVDANAVRRLLATAPPKKLIHVYGPTEATTFATFHVVESVPESATTVPIGLPIDATTVDVIDPWGQPCPTGVEGEVMIGGPGVAQGYFNDPAQTDQRFVEDPIRGRAVGPVFKTGDLARRGSGGRLEFIGRRDLQVKLRGFRLDLGAIESALTAHDSVHEAGLAVVGEGNQRRLVGAAVIDDSLDIERLRGWAGDRLADHEMPWRLMAVERLPMNQNGKVDRKAIGYLFEGQVAPAPAPAPPAGPTEPAGPDRSSGAIVPDEATGPSGAIVPDEAARASRAIVPDVAPRPSDMPEPKVEAGTAPSAEQCFEERMLDIWRRVIGRQDLGPDEEFFDAGGHSLLAIELMDAVEAEFGGELFVSDIFEFPTVTALAERLAADRPNATAAGADRAGRDARNGQTSSPPIGPADPRVLVEMRPGSGTPLFCFHGGGGDVVGYANLAWQINDGIPVVGVRTPGLLASEAPDRGVDDMLDRYIPAILARNGGGPFRLCGHSFGGILAYAAATRLVALGYEVEFLGLLDTLYPVDHGGSAKRLLHKFERAARQGRSQTVAATRKFLRHRYQRVRVEYQVASLRTNDDPIPARLARRRLKMRAVMAASAFQPSPYDGPVVFFKAMGNRKAGRSSIEDRWRVIAPDLTTIEVDGRHTGNESILTARNVAAIVAEINQRLSP